jgi:hypothetical protein
MSTMPAPAPAGKAGEIPGPAKTIEIPATAPEPAKDAGSPRPADIPK